MSLVERSARFLESKISRRSFVVRSAFVGSALSVGGASFLLEPGTAYAAVCVCGNPNCGCGTTCCAGYTEFCCVLTGANVCPTGTVMGGWWQAAGSAYCAGPRYYMDCNATCHCSTGCGSGYQFCEPGCDGLNCGCANGSCNNYLTGCFQFRYGQCNQHVGCIGRIKCRVVSCVAPWDIDPSCTKASAVDNDTANQNAACLEAPPPPPPPPSEDDMYVAWSTSGRAYLVYPNGVVLYVGLPSDLAALLSMTRQSSAPTISSTLMKAMAYDPRSEFFG